MSYNLDEHRPVKKELGLNRVFTQSKLDEAATLRKVLDE